MGRLRPVNVNCLIAAMASTIDSASVAYFLPNEYAAWCEGQPHVHRLSAEESFSMVDHEALKHYVPSPRLLPRFRQLVFVHLYSGYRREGDLQTWLESFDWSPALRPVVVSMDIIIDSAKCNAMDPAQRLRWFRYSQQGLIDGIMVGPPCESWSVSRERHELDGQGPRPLRRRDEPWITSGLSHRESRQVYVANILLFFAVIMFLSQWSVGAWACLEHPEKPKKPKAPSIWATALLQVVIVLHGVQAQHLFQGYFSAASPKPTTLLTCNDQNRISLAEKDFRTCSHLPPPLLMGKDGSNGYFRTAKLKSYPRGLCRLLAYAFWAHTQSMTRDDAVPPSPALDFFSSLVSDIQDHGVFGPDFAF